MLSKNIDEMKVEVASHIAADKVVQGTYWENNKGCFIGCLTHSSEAQGVEEKFGIPLVLVRITEIIFERLPEKEAVQFFADIPIAIGADNKDLSLVHWKFLRDTLLRLPKKLITPAIQTVIDGISLLAEGKEWSKDEAAAAESAADAAADAADFDAADAAAEALWLARVAARAAARAAWRVALAADAAAQVFDILGGHCAGEGRRMERRKQAQSIIQLLKDAPIKAAH